MSSVAATLAIHAPSSILLPHRQIDDSSPSSLLPSSLEFAEPPPQPSFFAATTGANHHPIPTTSNPFSTGKQQPRHHLSYSPKECKLPYIRQFFSKFDISLGIIQVTFVCTSIRSHFGKKKIRRKTLVHHPPSAAAPPFDENFQNSCFSPEIQKNQPFESSSSLGCGFSGFLSRF